MAGILKSYIGDKAFYKRFIILLMPIMIQNGITNFVNMLDNVMVGKVGTLQMTGVAVSNQLIFVFNLCIFGAVSGAGIFVAQFFGNGDTEKIRYTFRFKMFLCLLISLIGVLLFVFGGKGLINLYLSGEGTAEEIAASYKYAREYLLIMLIGLIPYAAAQCYSSTLRECGQSVMPMIAGTIAVFINLVFNYLLIFGKFGFPCLGVNGAAIATVFSRFVELFIVMICTYKTRNINPFIIGAFKSFYVPKSLIGKILAKGLPLMINEGMWAAGMATLNQCYSLRGINVVAATNISQTFFNVFSVVFISSGVAIGIVLGQLLGAGETENALPTAKKLTAFSVFLSVVIGVVYIFAAEWIASFYNVSDDVKLLATRLMQITAIAMPLDAYAHSSYFTLRSGGKTLITFIFDSGFMWVVAVAIAFVISRFTTIAILPMFAIIQGLNGVKCILGYYFVKKGSWVVQLSDKKEQ